MSFQQCLACNAVVSQPCDVNRSLFGFTHFLLSCGSEYMRFGNQISHRLNMAAYVETCWERSQVNIYLTEREIILTEIA